MLTFVFSLMCPLLLTNSVHADPLRLVDGRHAGDLSSVQISFAVEGRLLGNDHTTPSGDVKAEAQEVAIRVRAGLKYEERQLSGRLASAGLPDDGPQLSRRAARYYERAGVEMEVGNHRETTQLAPVRRLIVAQATEGAPQLYSPSAPLTRAELDLIHVPADSLVLAQLLPSEEVSPGSTWQHPEQAVAALFGLDDVQLNDCSSRLVKTERGLAVVEIGGTLRGRVDGVTTEVQLKGDYRYDIHWQRITWLQMQFREQRTPGHAAPGYDMQSQLKLLVTPLETPRHVTQAIDSLVETPLGEAQLLLEMHCAPAGFRLLHDRRWHLLHARHQAAAMRMVEGGDMIAQCQLIELPPLAAGKQVRLEQLQADIQKTLAGKFVQFQEATQEQRRDGYRVLRVVVQGMVSDVPVHWVYYHVANRAGRAMSAVFTLDPKLEERFSEGDRGLIASLEFVERARQAERIVSQ